MPVGTVATGICSTIPCRDMFALSGAAVTVSRAAAPTLSRDSIAALVQETVSSILGPDINPQEPLMASGLDSLGAVELRNALQAQLPPGTELPPTLMFDYPSIDAISSYIAAQV